MNELNGLGEQIIQSNAVNVQWQNNYDSTLVQAINDSRMQYVNYEQIYQQVGDFTTEEVSLQNQILQDIIKNQLVYLPFFHQFFSSQIFF